MRLDALLKRYFPVVVGLLLLASAYFQAKGLGYLVGATMTNGAPVTKRPGPKIAAHHEEEPGRPSGNVILERNPFDSMTGPLVMPEQPQGPPPTHPLDDPPCEVGLVTLIVWSEEDPAWSFAAIAGPEGVHLHRQGDQLGGFHVAHIGPDRIWLSREGRFCQIEVHDAERRRAMQGMPPPMNQPPMNGGPMNGGPQAAPPATQGKRPKGQLPPHIAERIRQTGPNQYDIDRTVVDEILTNQAEYLQKVRVLPAKQGDQTTGMRLMGVRKGTALDAIGLKHGDQLQRINGFEMTNPQSALEAYARLMSANQIRVDVVRNGQPTTLELNIK
ncbi:type II secretion system protein GspC [Polyangium sorediatum]|uniref:Type II secretion system protein GspC n=1 Tax=Polyangium sorediatum TaxID=889274 RepID=A0ABT6NWA0_9BACT|nr:type II secretion system protein GspC [Polyangium sorediatum]MDI1432583.1 type II secretion system protein GspC [Polyangium sorediatum]